MLGVFALVFGGLLAFAVIYPRGHPEIIVAAIVLQSLRALSRMRFHGLMQTAFGVSPTRNRAHAALLVAEVIVLAAALPVALR
jgi:hypothetical protein